MTNSRTDAHKSWMTTCFPRAMGFWLKQEALHLPLYNKDNQSISLVSVLQYPHFRSSRPELFCEINSLRPTTLLKKRLWHRCFSVNLAKFLRTLFSQNTPSGCFWHLHQSRFPILMLHVIHRQLRREYLLRREFLSMVERKISFSHVFSSE